VLAPQPLLGEIFQFPRAALSQAAAGGRLLAAAAAVRRHNAELRRRRFDLVLDAQGTYKSGALAALSGAPVRVGFAPGAAREFLPGAANVTVDPGPGPHSRVERALGLLRPLGADPALAAAVLPEDPTQALAAASLWAAAGPPPRVLLSPGASRRQDYKRWPAERYGHLAAALGRRGMTVRIAWGPGEEDLAREVCRSAGAPDLALPATPLPLLAELLRGADLFIGNDSGPMHLAWLVGTRVVALYGPTDPVLNAP
jgi:ADP-heptose:LPS heptosyltransferase